MPTPKPPYPAEFCHQMVDLVHAGRAPREAQNGNMGAAMAIPEAARPLPRSLARLQLRLVSSDLYLDCGKERLTSPLRSGDTDDGELVGRKIGDSVWAIHASRTYIERHGRPDRSRVWWSTLSSASTKLCTSTVSPNGCDRSPPIHRWSRAATASSA